MRRAVLDLGSNSFHLLVADVDGPQVVPVRRSREMLHLGRTVASSGRIPAAVAKLVSCPCMRCTFAMTDCAHCLTSSAAPEVSSP